MSVGNFRTHFRRERPVTLALLLLVVVLMIGSEVWGRSGSTLVRLETVFSAGLPLVLLAIGASLVLASGEIDLSVAGLSSLFGMAVMTLAALELPIPLAFGLVLVLAVAIGAVQAFAVVRTSVPSLVVTLGTSFIAFGFAFVLHGWLLERSLALQQCADTPGCEVMGAPVRTLLPEAYRVEIFRRSWAWVIVVTGITWIWRSGVLGGLRHLAVGMDRSAALRAALPVDRYRFGSLIASTLLCYLYTMLMMIAYSGGGWSPGAGRGKELEAIATAILGGTAIFGGWFSPLGLLLAAILWAIFQKVPVWIPFVTPDAQQLAIGLLIVVVGGISSARSYSSKGDER